KPTHGLVPTAGVIPLAWSLDHVGVFTREVADAAAAFAVLTQRSVAAEPGGPPRLALAPELLRRASREVAAHVQATADAFARAGPRGARVDGRRLAVRTVELRRRPRDLAAERARAVGASARHPARPGCGGVGATAERGGVVRAPARLHPIPGPLAMLDLKIEGAQVIDGTGAPGSRADVGIRDDVIVAVGDLSGESAGSSLWAA